MIGPFNSRYGWLKRLASEYTGERHVVIVKRDPTTSLNTERYDFEERRQFPPDSEDNVCVASHGS
jgi:hypothetical protein